jgi:hypothetical protein
VGVVRFAAGALALILSGGPSLAEEKEAVSREARDLATSIVAAHLHANDSESAEGQALRIELVEVQALYRRTLADSARGEDSGALQTLGAECQRLRPAVSRHADVAGARPGSDWPRIQAALAKLCSARDELAKPTAAAAKRATATSLLQESDRAMDAAAAPTAPTIRLLSPDRSRPR